MRFANASLANEIKLHYAEQGDSHGQVLVFIHGWPDSWFSFSRVLPLLPSGVRSIALDLRGFGESERPESGYRIDDQAEDVVAFLDSLSIERATLVGHSMGTFVARRVAIAHPERVGRLGLIATGLSSASPALNEARDVVVGLRDPLPTEFVRDFQSGTAYVPMPEAFFEGIVAESQKAPARVWRDALTGLLAYEDREDLTQISATTLLIWGDRDAVFQNKEDQERLCALIPNSELRIYPDTGHCPNWERPGEVAADLTALFEGTLDRTLARRR